MSSLMDAVRAGRIAQVVSLLDGMTDSERRLVVPELKALRKELRADRWSERGRRVLPSLHLAGSACQTGAAAVASWMGATDFMWAPASPKRLIDILADRDLDWIADVTHRLAQRPTSARVPFQLMTGLVQLSACRVPTTDAYVQGWLMHVSGDWARVGSLADRLRQEPQLAELVAALFEIDDVGQTLGWVAGDGRNSWPSSLARLAEEGALERKSLLDGCVARLLRGGRPADLRVFLRVLQAVAPTSEEQRERVADWTALAADAASTVAAYAQTLLAALALTGELPHRRLAEMSEAVLFRPEKTLVRAQLVLLGKVLAQDASGADTLLPTLAQAFGHPDSEMQERGVKLVERHASRIGEQGVRDELSAAAEQLSPVLRSRVAEALGVVEVTVEEYEENLPPVPVPVRLAPAPRSGVELAEEVGALLASGDDVSAFERTLDGLVRQAHSDPAALRQALEPVASHLPWTTFDTILPSDFIGHRNLELILAAVLRKTPPQGFHPAHLNTSSRAGCVHTPLSRACNTRIWEIAHRIHTDPPPFLLSTPTWHTGLIEPDELVDRLDAYRAADVRVIATDFAQALLRVRREDRASARAAAERAAALGTPEGTRLAEWLTADGPALPTARRRVAGPRVLLEFGELNELQRDFPPDFRPLGSPVTVYGDRWHCYHWDGDLRPHWSALLPERRELIAVRLLRDLSDAAVDDDRGAAEILPRLAESGGEAGPALHLGVAYGLGARHAEDRLAAVDALLVLAARGQLDAERLGTDLGELVGSGAVKPSRLVDSVRTAAATGASATVWGILRHALPALLDDQSGERPAAPPRGLPDLLAVAADCAERSGARGDVPHLARTAERRGSSRLLTQARRLRSTLVAEVAA
ncbi:secreted protein [Streptomyces davaonensis JCM 4913]|uniref:Secreted protein n=1 Tax=Streptomyces davaonensis (strain DSM 101723 / JCM 4913 / KCC S-0913 / 768) TaxID=1214101 RepID=K4RDC6_STRDJ|nr:DUF6493 family protein [Streptomyces davaonensis]CCK31693.1 secreted protein [Streptomyces davaonensis JCM 4913]